MRNVRQVILYLAYFIGAWLLISFGGAMVDSGNAAFWSNSLMWSLLSFLIVMPALVMVNHASSKSGKTATDTKTADASGADPTPAAEQKSFVENETERVNTLWPEPEQEGTEWPPAEARERTTQEHDPARA
jgi:hypothetical protein